MTMLKPGRRSRLAALLLVLLSSSAIQPANASNNVGENVAFTLRCLGLAFSDPDKHVEICNPVHHPSSIVEEDDDDDDVMPPPPPPPSPPEDEECSDGMLASECGGCYYAA